MNTVNVMRNCAKKLANIFESLNIKHWHFLVDENTCLFVSLECIPSNLEEQIELNNKLLDTVNDEHEYNDILADNKKLKIMRNISRRENLNLKSRRSINGKRNRKTRSG